MPIKAYQPSHDGGLSGGGGAVDSNSVRSPMTSGARTPSGPGTVTRLMCSRSASGRNISSQAEIGRSTPSPSARRSAVKMTGSFAVSRWVWNR